MNNIDKKLYEVFSDKTLSEGCLIKHYHSYNPEIEWEEQFSKIKEVRWKWIEIEWWKQVSWYEVIWHIPTIIDIFIKAKEKNWTIGINTKDIDYTITIYSDIPSQSIKYNTCKSLLEQIEETKTSLINIFK